MLEKNRIFLLLRNYFLCLFLRGHTILFQVTKLYHLPATKNSFLLVVLLWTHAKRINVIVASHQKYFSYKLH